MLFISSVFDEIPNLSVITEIEALSWINTDKSKEKIIREFILDSNILALTPLIAAQSVKIRRNRRIKTPDAIIAATAIVHNLELITNDDHFKNIEGLRTIDAHSL